MIPPLSSRNDRHRQSRGMSLVEVMVSATIFSFAATALVGLFLQNQRFATFLSYRSQAVTASLSVLEQLRFRQYAEMDDVYNAGSLGVISIELIDPSVTGGYQTVSIPVNVRDGVRLSSNWHAVDVVVDPDDSAPKLPMRFFFTLNKVKPLVGTKVDLFEVILLYQWLGKGKSTNAWQTGNVRLIIPNLNPSF